jgi:adenosylmethionine-8-amino-7-oxononanoate aminotransferase
MHGFTYSGHPVAGAVGLANSDIMEREGMVENAAKLGAYFLSALRASAAIPLWAAFTAWALS